MREHTHTDDCTYVQMYEKRQSSPSGSQVGIFQVGTLVVKPRHGRVALRRGKARSSVRKVLVQKVGALWYNEPG